MPYGKVKPPKLAIKSEDQSYYKMLALTISPPQRSGPVKFLLSRDIKILSKVIGYFVLYPEIDHTGRLHYHGYIQKKDIEIYLKDIDYIKRKIGFICVKDIKQSWKWSKYVLKEWNSTKKYLDIKKPITNTTALELKYNENDKLIISDNPFDQFTKEN